MSKQNANKAQGIGLRALFILAVTAVLLLTSLLIGTVLIRDWARYLHAELESKGISLAQILAFQAEYGVAVGNPEELEHLIEGLRHDPDVAWAAVTDSEGVELATGPSNGSEAWRNAQAESPPAQREDHGKSDRADEVTTGHRDASFDQGVQLSRLASEDNTWVRIRAPVWSVKAVLSAEEVGLGESASKKEGQPDLIGHATLVLSTARVSAALSAARKIVIVATVLAVCLGLLLTISLAHFVVGPVLQLAAATRRIAAGEMEVTVPESISRELADLTRSFNVMAESLQERDRKLQENAAELERRAQALRARQAELQAANDTLETRNQELRLSHEQLRTVNTELVHASRLKSEFLASMSHELRTPLNSIIGYTECLLDGLDGPVNEEQQESLERVQRNGRHLLGLINDILDLSKIESGKLELSISDIAMESLIDECMAMIRPLIRKKEIQLVRDVAQELPHLRADAARLRQILINLLTNAVKFTEKGQVGVVARDGGDGITLEVHDSGKGIPEDHLETIFQEFHQVDGPTSPGTGLGLAITRRLVERMGGSIQVKSTLGMGSTFTVWLPRGPQQGETGGSDGQS